MADQGSVFKPVTPEQLQGPFSGYLKPPEPTNVEKQAMQTQQGPANLGGGLAMAATAFIQGATQGRIKKYEQEQNERAGKLQTLNSYMISVANDPDLTPEAKQLAQQKYYQAIGGDLADATKDVGKSKDGGGSPGHHFGAIMKDLAQGLTGGKKPKGIPDPSNAIAQIHAQLYGPDGKVKPEYSAQARQGDFAKEADAIYAKYPPGTPPETVAGDKDLAALKARWQAQDPKGASVYFGSREAAYPAAPSVAAEEKEISQIGKQSATPGLKAAAAPQAGPAPAPGTTDFLTQGLATPGPPVRPEPGGLAGGAPAGGGGLTGLQLSGNQYKLLQGRGRVSKEDDFDLDGQRVTGHIVQLDSGPAFFDMNNRQMDVDLNKLNTWKGVQRVNISDPANPYKGISANKNLNNGRLYDPVTNIPLPPEMQKWQETTALIRPYQEKMLGVNESKNPIFRRADGTIYVDTTSKIERPSSATEDRWLAHFGMQQFANEQHDARAWGRELYSRLDANRLRINNSADNALIRIDANVLQSVKERNKAKAEVEARRKEELATEQAVYQQGITALTGGEGEQPPGYGKTPPERTPTIPRKTPAPPAKKTTPAANKVLGIP